MAAVTRAAELLRRAGIPYELHEYEVAEPSGRQRDGRHAWGLEAATALGVDPGRMFKTLVAAVDGEPLLVVVPVAMELDMGALASVRGGRRAELADPALAERLTGYQLGGISPLSTRRPLAVVLHEEAVLLDTILVSAGQRGLQVELAPDALVAVTRAQLAAIARQR